MPQAVAAWVVSAIGVTGVAATIVGAVVQLAVSIGLNALINSVFGKTNTPKPSDIQKVIRENVSSRVRHYGTVHVGGVLSFYESKDGTLYVVVTSGHGEIDSIVEHRLNNNLVTVDGSGVVQEAKYDGKIKIFTKLGTDDQTAYSELTAVFPEWDTDHRQRGCSNSLLMFGPVSSERFSDVYEGNTEPAYTKVIKASKVYDPRLDSTVTGGSGSHRVDDESTWEWSDNAALVIADYLAHEDGYGLGVDNINWDNIFIEANYADETVLTVDTRTIAKWRISGSYKMATDQRRAVLGEMMRACDGFMWQDENGLANINVGRWIAPTVSINDDHIVAVSASLGGDPQDSTNEVRVVYSDPRFSFRETESSPKADAAAVAADGREVQRFDIYYCPDHNQAARLGKRILAKLGERWALTLTMNLYGLNLIGERFVTATIADLAITNVDFEITALRVDAESNLVEVGLTEVRSTDFDFNSATEEGTPPTVPVDTEVTPTVPVPTGLATSAVQSSGGVGLSASWDENTSRPDLTVEAQYRDTSTSSWLPMSVSQSERVALTGPLVSGKTYGVRVRNVTFFGRISDWSSEVTKTVTVAELPPSTPTAFSVSESGGTVTVAWTNPEEINFSYVDIYRNTTDDFGTAATVGPDQVGALGESMTYDDTPASGTYYYWVVARSASGLSSPESASDTVTF